MSAGPQRIVLLHGPRDAYAAEIVRAALARSFSAAPIAQRSLGTGSPDEAGAVAISPDDADAAELAHFTRDGRKLLLLGALGPRVAEIAGLATSGEPDLLEDEMVARGRLATPCDVSPAAVVWSPERTPGGAPALPVRAFCRFDFEEEWNNLGHGRIPPGTGPWAAQAVRDAGAAQAVASIEVGGSARGVFAALRERPDASILWIGRAVGPVDGLDWTAVERFFSDHRGDALPCWPAWCDAPAGLAAGASFRLDCDEAVASARPLFERYRERGVPVSLAILAGLELDADDRRLVEDVVAAGGTVLSHSLRHLPDWGRDESEAREEARASRDRLEAELPAAAPVRYAVSPFHRNPRHAVRAVASAGYEALVTGIIANDPECLLGRAGFLPFAEPPLVSHSQQSMLHGDCFRRQKGGIEPWQESFEAHHRADALYGYLDHPFSARYAYGWEGEGQRIGAHEALLDVVQASENVWLPSQGRALAHLVRRSRCALRLDAMGAPRAEGPEGPEPLAARLRGRRRSV